MIDPRDQPPERFVNELQARGHSAAQARKLLGAVLGGGALTPDDLTGRGIASAVIDEVTGGGALPSLTLDEVVCSPRDQFRKLRLLSGDGLALETVLIPLLRPGAFTVCVSSQIGCVMGCSFCATARMTTRRNLATWEIIDQVRVARAVAGSLGGAVTGVVFMGMGEPFLNYDAVMAAGELLSFPVRGALSAKAITVSTVGLVQEIDRFTNEGRRFRLSVSLGAALDEKRQMLVPVAARTPVAEVMGAIRRHGRARGDRVNVAYVCVSGVNVGIEDAEALGALVGDTPIRLDLIDVTDHTGRFKAPSAEELATFRDALRRYLKQPVARRYSGGADIRAACGTLAGERNLLRGALASGNTVYGA